MAWAPDYNFCSHALKPRLHGRRHLLNCKSKQQPSCVDTEPRSRRCYQGTHLQACCHVLGQSYNRTGQCPPLIRHDTGSYSLREGGRRGSNPWPVMHADTALSKVLAGPSNPNMHSQARILHLPAGEGRGRHPMINISQPVMLVKLCK